MTATSNRSRRYSSIPPFREIHTPSELELERRLQALRARLGEDARIEIHRVEHQPACASHDARRCDCGDPVPVVIVGGREWVKLEADGTETPVDQAAPHPAWLDEAGGHDFLAEVMPIGEWLRLRCCRTVVTTIGDGDTARFVDGNVIDSQLSRRLARLENPQTLLP